MTQKKRFNRYLNRDAIKQKNKEWVLRLCRKYKNACSDEESVNIDWSINEEIKAYASATRDIEKYKQLL